MSEPIVDTRREQMFPTLSAAEIGRMRRFGTVEAFARSDALARSGETARGMGVILSGQVEITGRDQQNRPQLIVTHGPGQFMGELAQLSGRPALVDAIATEPGEALVIPPERLRALLIAEADLGERIMRALILRRVGLIQTGSGGPVIVGRATDADVLRLESFLTRNGHPHHRLDPDVDPEATALVERLHVDPVELPIVLCPGGQLLRCPTERELARCLGMVAAIDQDVTYDVAIVGGGPAGLAAGVYAGSEGLSALILDCRAFGGQAGASARIENYLGFPTGVSGMALMARAYNQAQKFGVEMAIPTEAVALEPDCQDGTFCLSLGAGERVRARSVVIAAGARYRRPNVPRLEEFEGASVHYWASPIEARLCAQQEVVLVGAGNSAGQAAVYLSGQVAKVWMLVRGPGLEASMSRYLIDRIAQQPNIEVVTRAEITALDGADGELESITWTEAGRPQRCEVRHLFLFIGAEPNSDWLKGSGVETDGKGFIRTPQALETNRPGVFAIGDIRADSVKRVASAVGEGAQVVAAIHAYLARAEATQPAPEPEPA